MLDHPDTLAGAFMSQHAERKGFTNVDKMNTRSKLAKTLLDTTYSHLKRGLDAKAGKQYQADIEEWNLICQVSPLQRTSPGMLISCSEIPIRSSWN